VHIRAHMCTGSCVWLTCVQECDFFVSWNFAVNLGRTSKGLEDLRCNKEFFDVFRGENENEPNQSWGYPTFRETNVLIYRVDRDISTVSTFPFHPHVPRPCLLPSSNMAVNWTASLNGQFQFNGKTIYNWRIVQRHVWLPECISFMCPVLFVKSSCGSVSKFEIPSFNVFRHFPL
jgi:hypothetical protein